MKLELEIPEWAHKRNIYVMAGQECLAVKYAHGENLYVKAERCQHCHKCCEGCPYTTSDGCKLQDHLFRCAIDSPEKMHLNTPECKIRYVVKGVVK